MFGVGVLVAVPSMQSLQALGDAFQLGVETERKRMLMVINPYATTVSDRLRTLVVSALRGRYDVDAIDTEGPNHATALTREAAAEGYDVVVAFGGDGTVNEAANGLVGSTTPLTCLPGGSANVYCRMLGIPNDIVDATEHLLRLADDWQPRSVDLPSVNGRRFLFSSGLGLDASVVRRVDANPRLKARLGAYYFAYAAFSDFFRHYIVRPPRAEVEVDGRALSSGVTVLVQNGDPYTYFRRVPIRVADAAALDDGKLAGVVLRTSRPTVMPTVVWRLFSASARMAAHRQVDGFSGAAQVAVRSTDGRGLPLHVDGDYIGEALEAVYTVEPAALRVVA
jgi:diacylglycerol kinase family enzyme